VIPGTSVELGRAARAITEPPPTKAMTVAAGTVTNELTKLRFLSGALEHDPLRLRGFTGRERLGQLYEFRLFLEHDGGPLADSELDGLLLAPCCFSVGDGEGEVVHGILRDLELTEAVHTKAAQYQATVVPSVWLLTLSKMSRVFQNQRVTDMAAALLTRYGLTAGEGFDVRIASNGDGAAGGPGHVREFAVQYDESDWDFIQRWLEHEGLYYWFEHDEGGDKIIIGDAPPPAIPGEDTIPYQEWNDVHRRTDSITRWRLVQRRIPARVVLKDYNYRNPAVPLSCQVVVDAACGFGTAFAYGEHFRDERAGRALAQLRAARLRAERRTFRGVTDCTRFRVGSSFELGGHFHDDYNQRYLITAIDHQVGFTGAGEPAPYRAVFDAIPADVPFRPERNTPWPSIHGVMHAHIDADSDGAAANLDEVGRYKVRLPFDDSDGLGDAASHWVRMAQSYAGAGYGAHYPLHKGTEVLLAFLDGDPDRPIIVGAVPNGQTPGPSARGNATQSVIETASGIRIEMEDRK
jgi:type VI secretion system secreted protein VgrG